MAALAQMRGGGATSLAIEEQAPDDGKFHISTKRGVLGNMTRIETETARLYRLQDAVKALYYAARWTPDRNCNGARLWDEVRDAAGITK